MTDAEVFEGRRSELLALAYRMLGDLTRAEDVVQDAWLRWSRRGVEVAAPRAYLAQTVTRLCLNELGSARARREESRGDRLPEPVDLRATPLARLERLEDVSMAFLVLLQRLSPLERAALLLHEVFGFAHAEVAALIGTTDAACRQTLHRARRRVSDARRSLETPPSEHRRLLEALLRAMADGDVQRLTRLLADDVSLVADAGPSGVAFVEAFGGARSLRGPLAGRRKVAAFVAGVGRKVPPGLELTWRELNGRPAALIRGAGRALAAVLIEVEAGRIRSIFMQADPVRLARLDAQV